jgi:hypothetical protein
LRKKAGVALIFTPFGWSLVMKTTALRKVCELDVAVDCSADQETRNFMGTLRMATLFHEDNQLRLQEIAEQLGSSLEEISQYAWLRAYLNELKEARHDTPSLCYASSRLGIELPDLERYIECRFERIVPWETEDDMLADLQQDAGDLATYGW